MTSCHPPAINQPLSSAHWQLSGIDVIDPKVARARQDDLVQRQFLGQFRDVPGDFLQWNNSATHKSPNCIMVQRTSSCRRSI